MIKNKSETVKHTFGDREYTLELNSSNYVSITDDINRTALFSLSNDVPRFIGGDFDAVDDLWDSDWTEIAKLLN